jgi:GLPGLI family protein
MKKYFIILLILNISYQLLGQNKIMRVQYEEKNIQNGYQFIDDLNLYESYSTFGRNINKSLEVGNELVKSTLHSKKAYTLIKDYNKNILLFNVKYGILRDTLNRINWKIIPGTKTILGYKCKIAKGNFRGRDYSAYFCPEIPVSDGPFKFQGLPGLILEIYSMDNFIKYTALEVVTNEKGKLEINNVWFENNISFAEYAQKRKRESEQSAKKIESRLPPEEQGKIKFSFTTEEIELFP